MAPVGEGNEVRFGEKEEGGSGDVGPKAQQESERKELDEFFPRKAMPGEKGAGEIRGEPDHAHPRARSVYPDLRILIDEKSALPGNGET